MTVLSHVTVISKGVDETGATRVNADEEYFYCDDEFHREDGPAIIKHNYAFDTTEEYYYSHGKRHRKNGPAVIIRTLDGATEEYYHDGKLDRKDGPAVVMRNADGSTVEEYYRNGGLHRKHGPAIVKRYADGSTEENYCEDGEDRLHHDRLHRFDGPAYVRRNADGSIREEGYFYGGVPRDLKFGPAVIKHNADGTTVREYSRFGTTVKTEYVNGDGIVVKTEQGGLAYFEMSLGADQGLIGKGVALQAAKPAPSKEAASAQRKPRPPGMGH